MNDQCGMIREVLPDHVAGTLDAGMKAVVEEHLRVCDECAAEASVVTLLRMGRPEAPAGMSEEIKRAVRQPVRVPSRPWWGLAAAAVAAIALGIGVLTPGNEPSVEVPAYVASGEGQELWLDEDGMIAGAPALDGLSDDALVTLLEEISDGGAA